MKEISYLLVGDKLNTRTLLVVLECLKDRAFHIWAVYVNSVCSVAAGESPVS